MNLLKKILFKLLSERAYVRVLHRSFYLLYNLGFLKRDKRFKYHYAIQKIIKPDDVVLDIGANLGYFAKTFAKLTPNGKVICVEPVPLFNETLHFFLSKFPQVEIHSVALGEEEGRVRMALPKTNGVLRTGLPHIVKQNENNENSSETIDVELRSAKSFFKNLDKIDYIKCDVEGYEKTVFTEIKDVINTKRPIVQIEIAEENRSFFFDYFKSIDYLQYGIVNFEFKKENNSQDEEGDFLFVPSESEDFVKQ